jgi:hypothetical protein
MYKIQTLATFGWADLKCSINGGPHEVELFENSEAAKDEIKSIVNGFGGDQGEYRVVLATEPADGELYD